MTSRMTLIVALIALCTGGTGILLAADWPMWGGTVNRNMVSDETGISSEFDPGQYKRGSDEIDFSTTKGLKWIAKMGSQTYGNPTVAKGRIFVGTNNDGNTDARFPGDQSLMKCLDEKTGKLLWQLVVPKLGSGKVGDWEYLGICSSPSIDDDRVYVLTNRCEVLCLDINGLADGNDGSFTNEDEYMAGLGTGKKIAVDSSKDADIIWQFDMRKELGVFPHNITSSSPIVVGDFVYVSTSNGVDWSHTNIPNPNAPSLAAFNKVTGALAGEEITDMGENILHGGWSSPAYGEKDGKGFLLFGGPDGILYAFDPKPVYDEDEELDILKVSWTYDGNPLHYRFKDGDKSKPIKYVKPEGPSEYISTPVVYKGRVYAAIGQDPEHGEGIGSLACLDLSTGKEIWSFYQEPGEEDEMGFINRSISTCAVYNDLVFIGDFSGFVYCFDANDGKLYWRHDTMSHIWGSPLVVDGKLYIGNEDGDLVILAATKEKKEIGTINFPDPVYSTPVVSNGVLYIGTATQLYAIEK